MTDYHIDAQGRLVIDNPALERLVLYDCPITALPELPETLERLTLCSCPVTALPELPDTLEWLGLYDCPGLKNWSGCLRWHDMYPLIKSGNRYWAGCIGPLTREEALAYDGEHADHDLAVEYKEIIGRDT